MTEHLEENDELKDHETQTKVEKEIDILEIVYKLWSQKKLILIWCMWGVLAGLIIAFSIPREFTTTVKLAPEFKRTNRTTASINALAALAGINTSGNSGTDAMYPPLYPEVVSSIPFLTSLFDVNVKDKEGNEYTVREYLIQATKSPWWGTVMGLPGRTMSFLMDIFKDKEDETGEHTLNNFQLTKEEYSLVRALNARIGADVDQQTYVISIKTQMQDPVVSAMLADTVVSRLRDYITEYRTDKSKQDLEYAEKLNKEAQEEYYKAQQRLADYVDRNQNLATQSARITRDRLSNEANLAFNLYNETSLQVQNAKSKVQETTPVYMEIEPASVPIKPSAPRKGLILAGFVFLAFVGACAWILFGKPIISEYKMKAQALKGEEGDSKESKASQRSKDSEKENHE